MLRDTEVILYVRQKLSDLDALATAAVEAGNHDLMAAWGEPGTPGDPVEISRALDQITHTCSEMVEWELDLASTDMPRNADELANAMRNWTLPYFDSVYSIAGSIDELVARGQAGETGTGRIQPVFEAPPNADRLRPIIDRLLAAGHISPC